MNVFLTKKSICRWVFEAMYLSKTAEVNFPVKLNKTQMVWLEAYLQKGEYLNPEAVLELFLDTEKVKKLKSAISFYLKNPTPQNIQNLFSKASLMVEYKEITALISGIDTNKPLESYTKINKGLSLIYTKMMYMLSKYKESNTIDMNTFQAILHLNELLHAIQYYVKVKDKKGIDIPDIELPDTPLEKLFEQDEDYKKVKVDINNSKSLLLPAPSIEEANKATLMLSEAIKTRNKKVMILSFIGAEEYILHTSFESLLELELTRTEQNIDKALEMAKTAVGTNIKTYFNYIKSQAQRHAIANFKLGLIKTIPKIEDIFKEESSPSCGYLKTVGSDYSSAQKKAINDTWIHINSLEHHQLDEYVRIFTPQKTMSQLDKLANINTNTYNDSKDISVINTFIEDYNNFNDKITALTKIHLKGIKIDKITEEKHTLSEEIKLLHTSLDMKALNYLKNQISYISNYQLSSFSSPQDDIAQSVAKCIKSMCTLYYGLSNWLKMQVIEKPDLTAYTHLPSATELVDYIDNDGQIMDMLGELLNNRSRSDTAKVEQVLKKYSDRIFKPFADDFEYDIKSDSPIYTRQILTNLAIFATATPGINIFPSKEYLLASMNLEGEYEYVRHKSLYGKECKKIAQDVYNDFKKNVTSNYKSALKDFIKQINIAQIFFKQLPDLRNETKESIKELMSSDKEYEKHQETVCKALHEAAIILNDRLGTPYIALRIIMKEMETYLVDKIVTILEYIITGQVNEKPDSVSEEKPEEKEDYTGAIQRFKDHKDLFFEENEKSFFEKAIEAYKKYSSDTETILIDIHKKGKDVSIYIGDKCRGTYEMKYAKQIIKKEIGSATVIEKAPLAGEDKVSESIKKILEIKLEAILKEYKALKLIINVYGSNDVIKQQLLNGMEALNTAQVNTFIDLEIRKFLADTQGEKKQFLLSKKAKEFMQKV